MERPVKDGIIYVQHCKFGKVKGQRVGLWLDVGFALLACCLGLGLTPPPSIWEGAEQSWTLWAPALVVVLSHC